MVRDGTTSSSSLISGSGVSSLWCSSLCASTLLDVEREGRSGEGEGEVTRWQREIEVGGMKCIVCVAWKKGDVMEVTLLRFAGMILEGSGGVDVGSGGEVVRGEDAIPLSAVAGDRGKACRAIM